MADLPNDGALSAVESSLDNSVQALLKEMSSHSASHKGVLRWSLQKKLVSNPSCSVSLIKVLVRELDKLIQIHKTQSYMHAIPVLHTLYYVVIQSGVMIPTSVYQKVYECLKKLLILPSPYSAVALSTLRNIKMEMTTPGSLYQRRVNAEQNLRSEHSTLQEKVFVLADPAVFSAPMEAAVRSHLEASNFLRDTSIMQKNVVLHVLQTGLGMTCQSSTLAQALEALGEQMAEKYFQEVVLAVETGVKHGEGGRPDYLNKLQHTYKDILSASGKERTEQDHGFVCSTALPCPDINFLLWRDDEDLWNLLADFATRPSSSVTSTDEGDKTKRDSVRSEDSGIERDLKESDYDDTVLSPVTNLVPAFTRRNAFKNMKAAMKLSLMSEKIDMTPGSSPVIKDDTGRHTARVVVMGDDRVLGRLTRAYHAIREKEAKHLFLTKKLNLQLYYIPVTNVEPSLYTPAEARLSLASLLGQVDPWYNCNINSLGAAISKLPGMHSNHNKPPEQNLFLDTLCYYLRCGTHPVNLPLYSVKMTRSRCDVVQEVFVSHLVADIPEFRHLKETLSKESNSRRKKMSMNTFGSVISVSYKKISLSKREVVKGEAPMTCGVVITSAPAAVTSGQDLLSVKFDSVNKGYNTTIQTQSISIRTLEDRKLSVCLDNDLRRTYNDVQRIEISPCLDPGCHMGSRFSSSQEREMVLCKYLDKVLSLPINTFSGFTL